ncbi:MAG: WG repeat-containing protein [Saprospiraceae bacterium]|nr:WG repeat-containing protein [Saprospiraceae bacterium]
MFSFPLSFLKNLCLLVIFAVSATAQSSEWQKEFQNKTSNLTIIDKEIAVMEYNYRFGLISIKKDTLIPPVYEGINLVPTLSRAIVSRHLKMGVTNYKGQFVIPMEYKSISENGRHFIAEIDSKMFLYDVEGKLIQTWDATDIESVDVKNKLIIIKDKYPLMGIQNFGGKSIFPVQYESIKKINHEKYLLQKDNKYILWHISENNEKIISCEDEVVYANQTGFVSKKRDRSGSVHDENGIRYTFDQITMNYNDKYVIGENESQSILFDETLDVIDSCSFCTIQALDRPQVKYIHNGHLSSAVYYMISKKDKTKKLLGKNNLRIEGDYHYFQIYGNYILGVKTYAIDFFDKTGQLLETIKGNRFSTHEGNVIIDVNDSLSVTINRDFQKKFVEGRGRLRQAQNFFYVYNDQDDNYTMINEKGNATFRCDQINSYPFIQNNGDAILTYEIQGKKGWINSEKITQPSYSDIVFFPDGTALVKKKGKFGRINTKEEVLLDFLYEQYHVLNQSIIFALKKGDIWHIFRNAEWLDSTETLSFEYDFFKYKKGDLWKTISKNGQIFPFNLESTYKDYITCENKQCKMYIRHKDYKDFLTFDTIFQSGYEYVGKIKDSLYYFNYHSKVETVVKGNKPEGRVSDYRIYDDGDSLVIINRRGFNPYNRSFKKIQPFYYGDVIFYIQENRKYTFFDRKTSKYTIEADTLYQINENIFAIRDNGKYDWLNIETNKKIKPVAKSIFSQTKKNYIAKDSLYFDLLLDKNYNIVAGPFDQIKSWGDEKYFEVSQKNKKAMLDTEGNILIPLDTYDSSFKVLSDLLISASKNGLVGVYHTEEKKWYPADKYQDIKSCNIRLPLKGELFLFRQNGKYGVMDEKCDVLIPGDYVSIRPLGNYLILEKENYKSIFYYVPTLHQVEQEFVNYKFIRGSTDNIVVKTQNEYIKYERDSITARASYDYVEPIYGEKRFFFRGDNGLLGTLDENFKVVIQPKYDYLYSRYNGFYQAHVDSYQGFIDAEEK